MAPPRQRTTAIVDDSRSEASSGTKEFKTTANKRKTAANKEKAAVTSAPVNPEVAEEQPRVCTMQISFFFFSLSLGPENDVSRISICPRHDAHATDSHSGTKRKTIY